MAKKKVKNDGSYETKGKTVKEAFDAIDLDDVERQYIRAVTFDAHFVTEKALQFGKILTGIPLYKYQEDTAYAIIHAVITGQNETLTMLFARQSGKCFKKGTKVLMYDLSIKNVEDVEVGDLVMGNDSTPRTVLNLGRGREMMYEIKGRTKYAGNYTVNASHILAYKERIRGGKGYLTRTDTVTDYLQRDKSKIKDSYVGYREPLIFPHTELPINPYFLGLWLGDGSSRDLQITTTDNEIVEWLEGYASHLGASCTKYHTDGKCPTYAISTGRSVGKPHGRNTLLNAFKSEDLFLNKHIPKKFIRTSLDNRRQLLAGIIDSDRHRSTAKGKEAVCEVTFKNKVLAEDVCFLARSIGLRATVTEKYATIKERGVKTLVHRISIYGDMADVPTLLPRKKYPKVTLRENPLHYGFDVIELEEDDYYGFSLDGNKLFLLGDLTVVHNTEVLAFVINTLSVLLPPLAKVIPDLDHFKDGIRIGLFAPQSDQVWTTYNRALMRLSSANAEEVMSDPDIEVRLDKPTKLDLTNGSCTTAQVASKQSKIEGATYDLLIIEEAQDVDTYIVQKSIEPMVSATGGTIVKCGTTGSSKNHFWYDIGYNRNQNRKQKDSRLYYHWEFDYKQIIRDKRQQFDKDDKLFHLNYEKDVLKKRDRLGPDSQVFRLNYALEWDLESGMLLTDREFAGLCNNKKGHTIHRNDIIIGGLDIGKEQASTVLTAGKVVWSPTDEGEPPTIELVGWLELHKLDYELQHQLIVDFIYEHNIQNLFADYTGVGKPVVDRLMYAVGENVNIQPFNFSKQSKSEMWFNLIDYVQTKRLVFPANKTIRSTVEWEHFEEQMKNCVKYFDGPYLVCHKADGFLDDYVDSLGLMCLATNFEVAEDAEEELFNPLFAPQLENRNLREKFNW